MKIKQTVIGMIVAIGLLIPFMAQPASADCDNVKTAIINCSADDKNAGNDVTKTGAGSLLVMAIQIMTAGVGVLAVGGIVYGAVLYASAADSAEQVKKARTIIINVVIGIVAYGLMYAILNFIIPGGLFT